MAVWKGLSLFLLLVGSISGADVDNEAFYGPNAEGLGDVASSLRQRKRKLGKDNGNGGKDGGKNGGKKDEPVQEPVPVPALQTVPVIVPQSVPVTMPVNVPVRVPANVPVTRPVSPPVRTTTSNGGSTVPDRSSSTPGIPVMTGSCPGSDKVVIDYGNFQLTESTCGYLEKRACVNPYTVSEFKKADFRTSQSCLLGTCEGCCRDFGFLECDPTGRSLNAFVPCVCSERTYGGVRFDPPTGSTDVVTAPVSAPAPSAPVPDRTGPGAPSTVTVTVTTQCRSNFLGQGLGQKPDVRPVNLPAGYSPGECAASTHCAGTVGNCCMRGFCLCGSPIQGRMNCLA